MPDIAAVLKPFGTCMVLVIVTQIIITLTNHFFEEPADDIVTAFPCFILPFIFLATVLELFFQKKDGQKSMITVLEPINTGEKVYRKE